MALLRVAEGKSINAASIRDGADSVVKAWYGKKDALWGDQGHDVTEKVKEMLRTRQTLTAWNEDFGDPIPGVRKELAIRLKATTVQLGDQVKSLVRKAKWPEPLQRGAVGTIVDINDVYFLVAFKGVCGELRGDEFEVIQDGDIPRHDFGFGWATCSHCKRACYNQGCKEQKLKFCQNCWKKHVASCKACQGSCRADDKTVLLQAAVSIVVFDPGPIGLVALDDTVLKVDANSQAKREGVQPGWRLISVSGQRCGSFQNKIFMDARNGNARYEVTFRRSTPQVIEVEPVDERKGMHKRHAKAFGQAFLRLDQKVEEEEEAPSPFIPAPHAMDTKEEEEFKRLQEEARVKAEKRKAEEDERSRVEKEDTVIEPRSLDEKHADGMKQLPSMMVQELLRDLSDEDLHVGRRSLRNRMRSYEHLAESWIAQKGRREYLDELKLATEGNDHRYYAALRRLRDEMLASEEVDTLIVEPVDGSTLLDTSQESAVFATSPDSQELHEDLPHVRSSKRGAVVSQHQLHDDIWRSLTPTPSCIGSTDSDSESGPIERQLEEYGLAQKQIDEINRASDGEFNLERQTAACHHSSDLFDEMDEAPTIPPTCRHECDFLDEMDEAPIRTSKIAL